jgi:hypothetical protein
MRNGTYAGLRSEVTATRVGHIDRRATLYNISGSGALKVPDRDAYFVPDQAVVTKTTNGRGVYAVALLGFEQRPASNGRPARLTSTRCWREWDFDALHAPNARTPAAVDAAVKAALGR